MKWQSVIPHSLVLALCVAATMVVARAQPSGSGTAIVIERAVLAASCSQTHVNAAITAATAGDTVLIPAGTCTWGASASAVAVNKAITVRGAGQDTTIVEISSSAGTFGSAVVSITAAATVRGFTIKTPSGAGSKTAFGAFDDGFRITDVKYIDQSSSTTGYFLYTDSYGVVDNSSITGGRGDIELIFARGPTDSWQTAHSIGGADNLFIENNVFDGSGYVTDCNANSRCVVRYNTIEGAMKVDAHGKASNSPARSVRHIEVYNNHWTTDYDYWAAIELRGGGGRVFNNVIDETNSWFILTEYGSTSEWPNFDNTCQCPDDYPVDDQIGVGIDPKSAASEPMYVWNNTKAGAQWTTLTSVSTAGCTATCGTFSITDIVQPGRDYFVSEAKPAAMSGYTPYTCPHPSVGAGTCSTTAGRAGYSVN